MPVHGVDIDESLIDGAAVAALRSDHLTRFKPLPQSVMVMPGRPETDWLIVDNTYPAAIADRLRLLRERPDWIIDRLPGEDVHEATLEMRDEAVAYMLARYPENFSRNGDIVTCNLTGVSVDVGPNGADPLVACLLLASEDMLTLMPRGTDPKGIRLYPLEAGVLAAPNGWSLSSKFSTPMPQGRGPRRNWRELRDNSAHYARLGKTTREIHDGSVQHYMAKYATGADRFFGALQPADEAGNMQLFERRNWRNHVSTSLFRHADYQDPNAGELMTASPELWRDKYIRTEQEVFRKLPKSGAVVFTIKTYIWPVQDLLQHPEVRPALFAAYDNMMQNEPLQAEYGGMEDSEHFGIMIRSTPEPTAPTARPVCPHMKAAQERRELAPVDYLDV